MSTRVKRNPQFPGMCPRCWKPRWLSRGNRLYPLTVLYCGPCDISWWYGRISWSRNHRDLTGKPRRQQKNR